MQADSQVLTGATGSLGAFLLDKLLQDKNITKVYCLVRAPSNKDGYQRVSDSLKMRKLDTVLDNDRVSIISCQLHQAQLGLDNDTYERLIKDATVVIHNAWAVNFKMNIDSFTDYINGTRNLIDLCLAGNENSSADFYFCSSISAVDGKAVPMVLENHTDDLLRSRQTGYGMSKLVSLVLKCAEAHNLG